MDYQKIDQVEKGHAKYFESVAKRIAQEIGGHYSPIMDEDGEIFSYKVVSTSKKGWTEKYAFDPANNDPNRIYLLEPNDEYELIVCMHIVEAQRVVAMETAQ